MMIKNKFLLLLLALAYIASSGNAQAPKNFSAEPAVFIKEMKGFLVLTNKKETELLMEKFEPIWVANFSAEEQGVIINTCNSMLKKRLKAFPDFSNYLKALMGFTESGQSKVTFDKWHSSIDKMLTGTARKFSDYIEICSDLFLSNILYQSTTTTWIASNNNYTFEFDSMPRIQFSGMDLTCRAKGDSSVITGISGVFYPLAKMFIGKGGKVYWTRVALSPTETYGELKETQIDLRGSDFISDSVVFYNRKFFKDPLIGRFTEKIIANATPETATYPRFDSYNLNLTIKELIKDADYNGGFSMHGTKMIGSGTKEERATLTFKRNKKPFLVASSRGFIVRPERISSVNASITIYSDSDSITHPSLELKYVNKDRMLTLTRNSESGLTSPFFNSFHQLDIYVDAIYWKVDDPIMELKMITGAGESKMTLESTKLFTDDRFRKIQGMSDVSPLFTLKQYAEKNSRDVYAPDYAKYLKVNEQQARSLLIFLSNRGFVNYDPDEDVATLNDKLYYYLSAYSNKTDYDMLEMASVIDAIPNAKLNLLNFDLDMQGVSRIMLSDSQNVYIIPNDQQVKLKKNRGFEFSGRVHAGRTDFFGKNFSFVYDQFKFNLQNVDSVRLKVLSDEVDENGKQKLIPIRNTLQNVTGTLYIDSADNKSSRKNYPRYPIFVSDKESYVYYDAPSIYNSVYSRDSFYFKMDPFTMDSLDNFTAGGLQFDGQLVSAGIFPNIKEKIIIRPDYSFGFVKETPPEGYSAYGGKGRFFNKIDLSYNGLTGDGRIDYLSSSSQSKSIVFFPDSTYADSTTFDLRNETVAGVAFPNAAGRQVFVNWQPKKDYMMVLKKQNDLTVYDNKLLLNGDLKLASKGLGGNGNAFYAESHLESKDFYFKPQLYGADTSDFSLNSDDSTVFAITTKNVKSKIDLDKRVGEFVSNGKGSYVSFPLNQYICFIAEFKWFMDMREVAFGDEQNTKLNIAGSDFVSVNPMQDSLRWNAGVASYSLFDYLIKARKVKEILVADASIQPNDTSVIIIEKQARMRPLVDATVIANTTTRFHTIMEANITIEGRKSYNGNGKYSYTDPTKVKHLVQLDRIGIDTSLQTYATGVIPDSSNFQLSTNILYKGKVNIIASNPLLNFDGYARVNHSCDEKLAVSWFGFMGDIDPAGVTIPVKEPRNENHEKLFAAIVLNNDSSGFYSTFLSPKLRATDPEIISTEGFLSYDEKSREYRIASKEKLKNADEPGNLLVLDDAKCLVNGEGTLNLAANFGQFKINTVGKVSNNLNNDSTTFDVMMGLDFMFSEDALKAMMELITSNPTLQATNDARIVWTRGMKQILGVEKTEKMVSEFNLYGSPKKVPQELQQTIFISDLKLIWDRAIQAYRSRGTIGVGFVNKSTIGRQMKGYVEILRRKGNDAFSLYLEADAASWWYFTYNRGILQAISSDVKFNDAIQNLKPDKRVADTKDNKPSYEYMLSTDRKKAEFIKRMTAQ